jgi:Macrocin-O-methyltransferase (TylF)
MRKLLDDDIEKRKAAILGVPDPYVQDGLISVHNHEFMQDPRFVAAYERGAKAADMDYGWHWRVHLGLWAASVAVRLPGDFVECGVNAGFMSSSIMEHLDWNRLDRTFWLLDTFSGLDPRRVTQAEFAEGILEKNDRLIAEGFYVTDADTVARNFSQWPRARLVKGSIPDTLRLVDAERIAFLHIDLNCAEPEVAALEHFWDRLSPGAPVLLDDYAYWGYRQQKLAMDALASRLGVAIASLPTGQGLLLRP